MGSDRILKKSVFGGFKKEDVLDYVERLQQEIVDLKRQASDNAGIKREFERTKSLKEALENERKTLKEEISALKEDNANLIEKNAGLSLKLEEAQVNCSSLCAELEKCKSVLVVAEEKYSELSAKYTEISSINNLKETAREAAESIKNDAKDKLFSARDDISSANDRLKTACVNFDSASVSLKSSVDALIAVLSSASDKLDTIGAEEE